MVVAALFGLLNFGQKYTFAFVVVIVLCMRIVQIFCQKFTVIIDEKWVASYDFAYLFVEQTNVHK